MKEYTNKKDLTTDEAKAQNLINEHKKDGKKKKLDDPGNQGPNEEV